MAETPSTYGEIAPYRLHRRSPSLSLEPGPGSKSVPRPGQIPAGRSRSGLAWTYCTCNAHHDSTCPSSTSSQSNAGPASVPMRENVSLGHPHYTSPVAPVLRDSSVPLQQGYQYSRTSMGAKDREREDRGGDDRGGKYQDAKDQLESMDWEWGNRPSLRYGHQGPIRGKSPRSYNGALAPAQAIQYNQIKQDRVNIGQATDHVSKEDDQDGSIEEDDTSTNSRPKCQHRQKKAKSSECTSSFERDAYPVLNAKRLLSERLRDSFYLPEI